MSALDNCPICSNPKAATFEERAEHGCLEFGEYWRCVWCGKHHELQPDAPRFSGGWCSEDCRKAHQAANPECDWFAGFIPIEDTLPGGRYDGVWENSGLRLVQGDQQ